MLEDLILISMVSLSLYLSFVLCVVFLYGQVPGKRLSSMVRNSWWKIRIMYFILGAELDTRSHRVFLSSFMR